MTDFFYDHEMRGKFRELEALDRRLTQWGWFRRGGTTQGSPGWRYRVGAVLVRLGGWPQCGGKPVQAMHRKGTAANHCGLAGVETD